MAAAGGSFFVRLGARVPVQLSRRRCIVIAILLLLLPDSARAASPSITKIGLFQTFELHSPNLAAFPKWRDMLIRFEQEMAECTPDRCRLDEWQQVVAALRGRKPEVQLKLVNKAINQHRYIEDWANWDLADYWETPLQFLDRSGDCEDFAIAKYLALRAAGMPADAMRIVIVRDHARQRMHAVLAVYVRGRALILDSLYDAIVEADAIDHYEPIYSINERGWWLHRR